MAEGKRVSLSLGFLSSKIGLIIPTFFEKLLLVEHLILVYIVDIKHMITFLYFISNLNILIKTSVKTMSISRTLIVNITKRISNVSCCS